jgi:transcriptional antiterminator RfaH
MSSYWFVIRSKPNKEDFLYSQLLQRQIEVYYPRLHVTPANPRSRKLRPFFPGYLFVHLNLDATPVSSLYFIPGTSQVVSFDSEPAVVSEEVIKEIKINVEKVNKRSNKNKDQFAPGEPVIISAGPFEGYQAVFDTRIEGSERVRLLIELLRNQQFRVQIPSKMVKPKKK